MYNHLIRPETWLYTSAAAAEDAAVTAALAAVSKAADDAEAQANVAEGHLRILENWRRYSPALLEDMLRDKLYSVQLALTMATRHEDLATDIADQTIKAAGTIIPTIVSDAERAMTATVRAQGAFERAREVARIAAGALAKSELKHMAYPDDEKNRRRREFMERFDRIARGDY